MIRAMVDGYNENRINWLAASVVKVLDESMSAWRPRTTKAGGLPHLSLIARKPEPLGTEFKTVACAITGTSSCCTRRALLLLLIVPIISVGSLSAVSHFDVSLATFGDKQCTVQAVLSIACKYTVVGLLLAFIEKTFGFSKGPPHEIEFCRRILQGFCTEEIFFCLLADAVCRLHCL